MTVHCVTITAIGVYIFKQIYFKINYLSPIWIQYNTSFCLKSLPWKTSFILIWQWTILFHKCGITTKSRMTLLYICFQTASQQRNKWLLLKQTLHYFKKVFANKIAVKISKLIYYLNLEWYVLCYESVNTLDKFLFC